MDSRVAEKYKIADERYQAFIAVADASEQLFPMSNETRQKLPVENPEERRLMERIQVLSQKTGRTLRPVHQLVLARLLKSEGYGVDVNVLGYINNPSGYDKETHCLQLTDQLNAALNKIGQFLEGTPYKLEKIKMGQRNDKIRLVKVDL